ncbi:MAG: hypothetical protein AB1491_02545 [Thermodesulfobacteriota bacterium]
MEAEQSRDPRDLFIAWTVKGKSFIDIGGLWGLLGEKVSVAHRHGATRKVMLDQIPLADPGWNLFHERMAALGVKDYDCVYADVLSVTINPFDVVHSAGILYHMPHPLQYIAKLRLLTRHHLILSSAIVPEHLQNDRGEIRLPSSGAMFVPALSQEEKTVLAEYFRQRAPKTQGLDKPPEALGITADCPFELTDTAPYWWVFTLPTVKSFCEVGGFRVLDESVLWQYGSCTLLCE